MEEARDAEVRRLGEGLTMMKASSPTYFVWLVLSKGRLNKYALGRKEVAECDVNQKRDQAKRWMRDARSDG